VTFGAINTKPIVSILYDRGWEDMKAVGALMDAALNRQRGWDR
jgi:hypothetical protein